MHATAVLNADKQIKIKLSQTLREAKLLLNSDPAVVAALKREIQKAVEFAERGIG